MKIYQYRKHIRQMRLAIPGLLIVLSFLFLILMPAAHRWSGVSLFIPILFILEAALLWWIFGRLAAVRVSLGETGIAYQSRKRLIEIPYDQITEIQQPSIRYLGGWIKIKSDTETIRLTVVLEGIGDFVRNLKAELDQRDMSSTYRSKKLFRFYKTAAYADQSWERVYELGGKIALVLGLSLAIGGILGWTLSGDKSMGFTTSFWVLGTVVWMTLVYLIAEFLLGRRLAKGADESSFQVPERDRAAERRVYKNMLLIGAALYFVAVIVILLRHFGAS